MKILFYDWSLHMVGGGQRFNCKIIEHLAKTHKVDVLTLFPANKKKMEEFYSVNLSRARFKSLKNRSFINQNLLKVLVSGKVSRLSKKYDLFFNGDAQETANPQAKYNIMYCHFFEPGWYRKSKNLIDFIKLLALYTFKLFRKNYAGKYQVYCNSNYTKYWLKKLWKVDSAVIYPPVDIPKDRQYSKQRIILSTGRITPDKNYEAVIEIFKKASKKKALEGYKLLIYGKSENEDYLEKLKKLAANFPIEFKTDLSDEELKEAYSKSKIFIQAKGMDVNENKYPAMLEHFGMAVVEAMSYGCIPMTLNKGGYKETVPSSAGMRFNTIQEAVSKLIYLMGNTKLQKMMEKNSRAYAKKFSLTRMQSQIDDLIKSVKGIRR